jgi:hypothetical protein
MVKGRIKKWRFQCGKGKKMGRQALCERVYYGKMRGGGVVSARTIGSTRGIFSRIVLLRRSIWQ